VGALLLGPAVDLGDAVKKKPIETAIVPQSDPAWAPSSLDVQRPSIFAKRPELRADVERYAKSSRSKSSWKALGSDSRIFIEWCNANDVSALPAEPETVAAFLSDQVRLGKSLATILRYRATISTMHRVKNLPSPSYSVEVKSIVQGMRREIGTVSRKAKSAMTSQEIRASHIDRTGPVAIRDRALVLIGLASAMRRSELCGLDFSDLRWSPEGVVATIRRSKTDQEGAGRQVAIPRRSDAALCPVTALLAWMSILKARGIDFTGPVFRPITRGGRPLPVRLDPAQVATATREIAVGAGMDGKTIGGHSLRAGFVTEARRAGIDWGSIMDQTGHKKVETVKRYDRGGGSDKLRLDQVARVFADREKK